MYSDPEATGGEGDAEASMTELDVLVTNQGGGMAWSATFEPIPTCLKMEAGIQNLVYLTPENAASGGEGDALYSTQV